MRIFLDTNVLASSIATRGLCNELVELVMHDHELLTCAPLLSELRRVLTSKLRIPRALADEFLDLLRSESEFVADQVKPSRAIADPDDVPLIACAIAGRADFFVTGDKELLQLAKVDGIPLISPRELWIRLSVKN